MLRPSRSNAIFHENGQSWPCSEFALVQAGQAVRNPLTIGVERKNNKPTVLSSACLPEDLSRP